MNHDWPPDSDVPNEWASLTEKFCLQTLNEEENRKLNGLLRYDPRARSFFIAYAGIHARLSWDHGPVLAEKPLTHFRSNQAENYRPSLDIIGWLKTRFYCLIPQLNRRSLIVGLGCFATLVILFIGRWFLSDQRKTDHVSLAVLTQCFGALTSDSRGAIHPGQPLGQGMFTLDAGTVEISIQNGVKILLEGPATVELMSPMRAYLHSGQAVVHVPEKAAGFVLETRDAKVMDLGTEFGLKVGPSQGTDVQVYQGSVFTTPKSSGGLTNSPQRLLAGSAARIISDSSNIIQNLAFAPDRFVRQLPESKKGTSETHILSNQPKWNRVEIIPVTKPLVIDGNLSEWNQVGRFHSHCEGLAGKQYAVAGMMRYDSEYLYIGAHVSDPEPMRNVIDPVTDGDAGWRGGGLQVRISTDRNLGWPLDANADVYYQSQPMKLRLQDTNEKIVHLTLWHHAPSKKNCLHLSYGMDFHGNQTNPNGYQAAFQKDAEGTGYNLEYAIPWMLLKAQGDLPRAGDTLAVTWTVHWSDESGRRWRGQLVEIRNSSEPLRINNWDRAASWGQAVFR